MQQAVLHHPTLSITIIAWGHGLLLFTVIHIISTPYGSMGQNLSEPVTEKDTSLEENHFYKVGCSSMQGWRNGIPYIILCVFVVKESG